MVVAASLVLEPGLGGAIPSGSDIDGEIDAMGFSTLGVCNGILLSMGGPGDTATTGSFITPVWNSSSLLGQLVTSMTRARCQWSSWTALQNVSGGDLASMVHC